jgi:hypothetical protein
MMIGGQTNCILITKTKNRNCTAPKSARRKKWKAILAAGSGDSLYYQTSKLSHFLDNSLKDGGKVVNLARRPTALYPQEDRWYSFLLEDETAPGSRSAVARIKSI